MTVSGEKIKAYIEDVYVEMKHRGFTEDEADYVISKTGFMDAIEKYPEEQLHYDVSDTVDELIMVAAKK